MRLTSIRLNVALSVLTAGFTMIATANAATVVSKTVFAKGADVSATAPDSLTLAGNKLWASYGNGADSTGQKGGSTIVEYSLTGQILKVINLPGNVDGLKFDPGSGFIAALQNQDGNSTAALIDPATGSVSPLSYGPKNPKRGYDDVVFLDERIFLSYTNPVNPGDAVIQQLNYRVSPPVLQAILTFGALGLDQASKTKMAVVPLNDPDSLKTTPTGGLMLTSGDDGALTFVESPGTPEQTVSFLQLTDSTGAAVSGLDDAIWTTTPKGVFYVSDTTANTILKVEVSDIESTSLFASVASLKTVGHINLKTGVVIPFIDAQSPHGLVFVPDFNSLF